MQFNVLFSTISILLLFALSHTMHRAPLSPYAQNQAASTQEQKEPKAKIGYEILHIISPRKIVVWASGEISQVEFDAIDLPFRWIKNQAREVVFDRGSFARSPEASVDGPLQTETHFGHAWKHVATIRKANQKMDSKGLLRGNTIEKHHQVSYRAGKTIKLLISPIGERYVLATRDAQRTRDTPVLPDDWQIRDSVIQDTWTIQLHNPTINIRTDNEDSFQGPV